jgi:hypothetical protein
MIDEQIDSMVVDWLEELPLDELPTDYSRMIVNDFREGHMSVTEAISLLNEDCYDDMADQIKQNQELQSLLGDIE